MICIFNVLSLLCVVLENSKNGREIGVGFEWCKKADYYLKLYYLHSDILCPCSILSLIIVCVLSASWSPNVHHVKDGERNVISGVRINSMRKTVMVLLSWAVELHHNCSLSPSPWREGGRKYDRKSSRLETRIGRSLINYCHGQNRLSIGRLI